MKLKKLYEQRHKNKITDLQKVTPNECDNFQN